jgi:hypothetical protein
MRCAQHDPPLALPRLPPHRPGGAGGTAAPHRQTAQQQAAQQAAQQQAAHNRARNFLMTDYQTRKARMEPHARDPWWAWPFAIACGVLWATALVYGF